MKQYLPIDGFIISFIAPPSKEKLLEFTLSKLKKTETCIAQFSHKSLYLNSYYLIANKLHIRIAISHERNFPKSSLHQIAIVLAKLP